MKKITIIYGSTTGNTKNIAQTISKKLSTHEINLLDVSKATLEDIEKAPNLILGTSTWGVGDIQDDWDSFLPKLKKANLTGKIVALFGVGDSCSYADTFVDGMGILQEALSDANCQIVGDTSTDGHSFSESRAVKDDKFIGLALDEDNESDKTESRLNNWLDSIRESFQ